MIRAITDSSLLKRIASSGICQQGIIYSGDWLRFEIRMEYSMSLSVDDQKTKALFKQAMIELLEERKDLFYDLFAEVIEDTILVNAIREGASSDSVSRAEIFKILEGAS